MPHVFEDGYAVCPYRKEGRKRLPAVQGAEEKVRTRNRRPHPSQYRKTRQRPPSHSRLEEVRRCRPHTPTPTHPVPREIQQRRHRRRQTPTTRLLDAASTSEKETPNIHQIQPTRLTLCMPQLVPHRRTTINPLPHGAASDYEEMPKESVPQPAHHSLRYYNFRHILAT